ncbi:spermidine synthase [Brachybacterium hainanense]|uniref:Spermidine synthase n=1 Tax=Brachybacterium hainanense TaxID=1541174 RepID=A0ABV6RDC7_9MICO
MSPASSRPREIHLGWSGTAARIARDGYSEHGWVLALDGREQSHVDLEDPRTVRHEYLARMTCMVDALRPVGAPLTTLHLGAGALTLARYLQVTRPGSSQVVVEIERELPGFVMDRLPLPPGTDLRVVIGDAREQLARMESLRFDLIVLDVFTGEESPTHLACSDFYDEAIAHLSPGGALLVNIGDDAGLRFFARQARQLETAAERAGVGGAWTLCAEALLDLRTEGNLVVGIGNGLAVAEPAAQQAAWIAAGPHPAAVLDPDETAQLVRRIERR